MSDLDLIPAGRTFTADEITVFADSDSRTLDEAIAEADVLVSAPHAGARIPEELVPLLSPALTRRLQYDFTDVATAAIVREWAQRDRRIVAVINPHPRLVRDPNRARPADIAADLTTAIERTRAAGPWQKVDLSGVDAIRPVTFSFFPILAVPGTTPNCSAWCTRSSRSASAVSASTSARETLSPNASSPRSCGSAAASRACRSTTP
ncbi:N-formylglutamate amidohydrolase [Microbacterium sp. Se63.02b]|uniref:N-formylglutamate amidohydrolase n=1 Tax=Microbacterium sp. Se63.02b TaxID=2709304 RepID=UPI001FCE7E73|nr:N-formylglutamate amidohydrolase [Microbacterium sp. Se63.02b]